MSYLSPSLLGCLFGGPSSLLSVGRSLFSFTLHAASTAIRRVPAYRPSEGFVLFCHSCRIDLWSGGSGYVILHVISPFLFFQLVSCGVVPSPSCIPKAFVFVCSCHSVSVVLSACISIILGATVRPLERLPDFTSLERWSICDERHGQCPL